MNSCGSSHPLVFSLVLRLFCAISQSIAPSVAPSGDILADSLPNLSKHEVPAVYVFGDSLLDSGNNNFLATMAKANYPPYGIDFDGGKPTGRFTDGKTAADLIAQLTLGLPLPPAYLGLSESEKNTTLTGVNYASGSCGILPDTGSTSGTCLTFDKQIDLFQSTVEVLNKQFISTEDFEHYLSKSLFFVNIGSNDFFLNYALPGSNLSKQYTPPAFAQFLSQELFKKLQRLHGLGARKFLVHNVGALGCIPAMLNALKPPTLCVDAINGLVSLYNRKLPSVLEQLQSTLPGFKYVHGNVFDFFMDVQAAPTAYGLTDPRNSCCVDIAGNGTTPCLPNKAPCKDIKQHVFFDPFHPTEATHLLLAKRCLLESSVCTPINLNQLLLA